MLEAYSRAWTEIDYDAIRHNVNEVRKLVKNTKIMGIVKANAYGLGDVACAKALQECGVDYFGVSSIDEALNLRNAKQKDWALMFIFSIVSLILGVLIILDPIVGFFEITLPVIGTCIAIYEIINIIESAYVLKKM